TMKLRAIPHDFLAPWLVAAYTRAERVVRRKLAMQLRITLCLAVFLSAATSFGQSAISLPGSGAPTYAKDVAPILQKNCQVCHRPGEAGPFALLTYEQARPWATAMKIAVQSGKMPPWFADPHYGKFSNSMSLSAAEMETLAKWADAGAPKGDPKD